MIICDFICILSFLLNIDRVGLGTGRFVASPDSGSSLTRNYYFLHSIFAVLILTFVGVAVFLTENAPESVWKILLILSRYYRSTVDIRIGFFLNSHLLQLKTWFTVFSPVTHSIELQFLLLYPKKNYKKFPQ